MNTWNRERKRTRDRLLEYDFSIVPPLPHSAGLPYIYPWESINLAQIGAQIIEIIHQHGYTGSDEEFWNRFSTGNVLHVYDTLINFPVTGYEGDLYLDKETDTLYYFKVAEQTITNEIAERLGIVVIDDTNLYIPIRALPLEDLIYSSGGANID